MATAIQVEMMHQALAMARKGGQYTPYSIDPAEDGEDDVHYWVVYAFRRGSDGEGYDYVVLNVCTDLVAPYVRER